MAATNIKKPQWTRDGIKVENQIIDAHKPDAKLDVDTKLLLAMAQAILSRLNATFSLPSYCKQSSHTDLLNSLRSGKAPLQNITMSAGYTFTGMSLAVLAEIFYSHFDSIALTGWCVCVGFFLVKNMKGVVFEEVNITSDTIEKAVSEELVFTIHKIGRELSCDCSSGGDMKLLTVAVFDILVKYSWEDKLVIALLAFAVNYGEFRLLRNRQATDSLTQYVVHFKPSPDMISERESLIVSLLKAVMALSQTINSLNSLDTQKISRMKPPFSEAVNQIPYAVYYAIKGIVACSSRGIGVTDMDHQYSITEARQTLTDLTEKLENMSVQLTKLLDDCEKVIRNAETDKAYNELKEFMKHIHNDNVEVFNNLIQTKDNEPLFNGVTNEKVSLNVLESKTVILFISYYNISDEEITEIVQQVGETETERPYKIVWLPIVDEPITTKEMDEIGEKASLMKWHSLHYSVTLQPHVIQYIKKHWKFEKKPLLVAFNSQGNIVSYNAYPMIMIWGNAACPFDAVKEQNLWINSEWSLEFLIGGAASNEQWEEEGKLTFLYGGNDLDWIKEFTYSMKKVVKGEGIKLIYVGEKHRETIKNESLSEWWDDQEIIRFWARLERILHSKMKFVTSIDNDNTFADVRMLLGCYGSGGGWTVTGHGSQDMIALNGEAIMECLGQLKEPQVEITFANFYNTLYNLIPQITVTRKKHCNHIYIASCYGTIQKNMVCVECRCPMEKYIMYKC